MNNLFKFDTFNNLFIFNIFLINNTIYTNNIIFSFIGGINIITHAIFMKVRIVHSLRADWL